MSEPIWKKNDSVVDERLMRFLAGEDVILDRELFVFDIEASQVHARGLGRIGILTVADAEVTVQSLAELRDEFLAGRFVLGPPFEDGHSAIESWLTERLGDLGRRIHTGRSRNDQVLVAMRLYLRDRLNRLARQTHALASQCLRRATAEPALPMPGYTHLQRAVVSSTAMWWAGWAETFADSAALALRTRDWVNANPLGTAAGYGVNLALDRDYTTVALKFDRMQISPIAAQLSRGKYEWQALAALVQSLNDVRRVSWDISLFTSAEYGFVGLPAEFTTGSSLMPNKRNPDVVELLRAAPAVAIGAMTEVASLAALPSGYHRDQQAGKAPLLRAFAHGLDSLGVCESLLAVVHWNADAMRAAIDPGMYATDVAIDLARSGVPFREAYGRAADLSTWQGEHSPESSLSARVSAGGAANLCLDGLRVRLATMASAF
ncbi:MAG: argininosuccinate lyase [Pseudomonadota bacterium]|nr:argininosuccinate lyase [Pseudomonadota bacterium]